jgi:hypothetical protein
MVWWAASGSRWPASCKDESTTAATTATSTDYRELMKAAVAGHRQSLTSFLQVK